MCKQAEATPNKVRERAFIFDGDGVIVQWTSKLAEFAKSKGLPFEHIIDANKNNLFLPSCELFSTVDEEEAMELLREYNRSEFISQLTPMSQDTGASLNKISELGKLILVTCIGTDPVSFLHRTANITNVCGANIFEEMHFLDVNESKENKIRELAERYDVGYFVDDRARHVTEGINAGVTSYQFALNTDASRLDQNLCHAVNWLELIELAHEFKDKMDLRDQVFA
ncbi:hypothetical protein OTK49_01205 [Vibrio coralliirubri]|uniref:hypothetical protein n=1 Tax=Vibrio coralliirubri TaxID=1516159 RepID=UPI0022846B2D|nr:hypothetical protein [Vibrio coralliirubri]MCY9861147.1 hypothetical protein [Vibrio coralliirubri]